MGGRERESTVGPPPLGQFQEVRGSRLLTQRSGEGAPAVVFLPGAGAVGLDYWNVWVAAGDLTTSVVYDRAGTGWSERVDLPRSATDVTDELRDLLKLMEIDGPHFLVGHSLGGLYARHFAVRFPDDVAGLVLLDPAHEDYNAYMPEELVARWESWDPDQMLPDELPAELVQFYRSLFASELAGWPAGIREPLIEAHTSRPWLVVGLQEASNVEQLYDEVRAAGPWPDVPTTILYSTEIDDFKRAVSVGQPESLFQSEIEGKKQLYEQLAKTIPEGQVQPVGGGHVTMHLRHPEAVTRAVRELLAR
jgi:pimeloyl-ACP methyl ester carboxylesterase